jgi:hypothetical protein
MQLLAHRVRLARCPTRIGYRLRAAGISCDEASAFVNPLGGAANIGIYNRQSERLTQPAVARYSRPFEVRPTGWTCWTGFHPRAGYVQSSAGAAPRPSASASDRKDVPRASGAPLSWREAGSGGGLGHGGRDHHTDLRLPSALRARCRPQRSRAVGETEQAFAGRKLTPLSRRSADLHGPGRA